jgi:hypothetical protein
MYPQPMLPLTQCLPPLCSIQPPQPTRLMAVVLAKNTVGSNWRKTLGSREWVRVPAAEQAAVRGAVLQLLLTEPSDRWVVGVWGGWEGWGGEAAYAGGWHVGSRVATEGCSSRECGARCCSCC